MADRHMRMGEDAFTPTSSDEMESDAVDDAGGGLRR